MSKKCPEHPKVPKMAQKCPELLNLKKFYHKLFFWDTLYMYLSLFFHYMFWSSMCICPHKNLPAAYLSLCLCKKKSCSGRYLWAVVISSGESETRRGDDTHCDRAIDYYSDYYHFHHCDLFISSL